MTPTEIDEIARMILRTMRIDPRTATLSDEDDITDAEDEIHNRIFEILGGIP